MEQITHVLSSINNLSLSFLALIIGIIILVYRTIISTLAKVKFISFLSSTDIEDKWFGQIIGSLFIVSLALVASNTIVYVIAVIVIATLVTRMEFLLWVLTLIGNRVELAKTMMNVREQEEAPIINTDKVIQLVDKIDDQGKKLQKAEEDNQFHLLTEYFYDTYSWIFGSQIEMLRMIESIPNQKAPRHAMERFHSSTPWKDTYPFFSYINFLINRKLLDYDPSNDMYTLTDVGKTFLAFLVNKGLNTSTKQPF